MKLKVVELFAGVGGFRVGLNSIEQVDEAGKAIERGEWDFVWANQYEPSTKIQHAHDCYTTRFGEDSCSNEDIHEVDKTKIPDHTLLVGGFPCQDYSVARSLSNEKGIEGKKGVLFWDIKDVIKAKNPPFVLLENVDRLLKSPASMRGRDFAIMLKTFEELGYNVIWRVINAGEYGMPQKRRRVFIFAFKQSTKYSKKLEKKSLDALFKKNIFTEAFPIEKNVKDYGTIDLETYKSVLEVSNTYKEGKFLTAGIMINGVVAHGDVTPQKEEIFTLDKIVATAKKYNADSVTKFVVEDESLDKWKYLKGSKKIERTAKNGHKYVYSEGSMAFPEKMDEPARTMLTSEGTLNRSSHIIFDEDLKKYRLITPVEAELIQMFPPNWTNTSLMTERKRYFMMGNALVTGIINRLEPKLRKIIIAE